MDWLRQKSEESAKRPKDIDRVLQLPIWNGLSRGEIEAMSRVVVRPEAYASGFRLRDVQAEAIFAIEQQEGAFGSIGVGWGKTLITGRAAASFYRKGYDKGILVVPTQVYAQLTEHDLEWIRSRIHLHGVPFHLMGGIGPRGRKGLAQSNYPGCYIMTYSLLSQPDSEEILNTINPSYVILDEAHSVSRKSARTDRLWRYVREHGPRMVALSGTITRRSLIDYHHLIDACLREGSPLPRKKSRVVDWANILDAEATPTLAECELLRPLVTWAQEAHARGEAGAEEFLLGVRGFRRSYHFRFEHTPGVITTGEHELGVSLVIENHKASTDHEGYTELETLRNALHDEWVTPDGDEIDCALNLYKWDFELSAGFYNRHVWPEIPEIMRLHNLDEREAKIRLERSQVYLQEVNKYHKLLRHWLEHNAAPGMDTPFLVGAEMTRNGAANVGSILYNQWLLLRPEEEGGMDFMGRIERIPEAVRVCPYKIEQAYLWAREKRHGLVWYHHNAIGDWLYERLRDLESEGIEVVHGNAGKAGDRRIRESKGKICVASISAHFQGKNLQTGAGEHQNNWLVQCPRSAMVFQQLIGRTHRMGQGADSLTVGTNLTNDFDELNYAAMLNDAVYVQQTTGERQKAVLAVYNPTPKIFPPEVLKERGFHDIRTLSPEDETLLRSKFDEASS